MAAKGNGTRKVSKNGVVTYPGMKPMTPEMSRAIADSMGGFSAPKKPSKKGGK